MGPVLVSGSRRSCGEAPSGFGAHADWSRIAGSSWLWPNKIAVGRMASASWSFSGFKVMKNVQISRKAQFIDR